MFETGAKSTLGQYHHAWTRNENVYKVMTDDPLILLITIISHRYTMSTKPTLPPSLRPHCGVDHTEDQAPEYAVKNIDSDLTTALPSLIEYGFEGREANIQGESKKQLKRYSLAFSLTTFGVSRLISSSPHPRWASIDE